MKADRVEVSWDSKHANWSVRMEAGEEVIHRHSDLPKNTVEPSLRFTVAKMVRDEGFDVDEGQIVINFS